MESCQPVKRMKDKKKIPTMLKWRQSDKYKWWKVRIKFTHKNTQKHTAHAHINMHTHSQLTLANIIWCRN